VLAYSTAGATGFLFRRPRANAASAGPEDFPIPADKGLDPAWLRSLPARGEPAVLRGRELTWVGMPVGGIGCGQVYLGGDGRLWHWDVFNQPCPEGFASGNGPHYAKPLAPASAGLLGFTLEVASRNGGAVLPLSAAGFDEVEFRGTYPIGTVTYRSARPALEVVLEAFSPFVPLELEDSSLPATVLAFRVRNRGELPLTVTLRGVLENPVCRWSEGALGDVARTTRSIVRERHAVLVHAAERTGSEFARPDIPFEDFERPDWAGWTVEGTAFGPGPVEAARMPAYQGQVGAEGARLANSHNVRAGEDVAGGDAHVGALLSREFTIERAWITFLIGGGSHPGETCVELLVDGEVMATATGANENRLRPHSFFVGSLAGRRARLRIADRAGGGWGNVGVDSIVFSDSPRIEPVEERGDFGTIALGVQGGPEEAELRLPRPDELPEEELAPDQVGRASATRKLALEPAGEAEAVFVVAWHFPNVDRRALGFLGGSEARRRHYAARFADAGAVAEHVLGRLDELAGATRRWRDTWYDSTLPYWFLDRTFASLSTLATSVCTRLDDGRFHGWEGVYCCAGTCTHVWQYAQGPARLFPALERDQRERVDLGLAFDAESGRIDYRAEAARELAVDGQAGTILRVYREHTLSADDAFLRRVWPRVRKALELLLGRDTNLDGILDGAQYNTLDAAWFGEIAWLSSLYLAAVRAGEAMASEMGDAEFAGRCRVVLEAGARSMVTRLFDGEYFVHRVDPGHPEANSTGAGCHIDQVLGQSWAHQVGLGRILPEPETRAALASLWKYSFAPDVGPYRKYMEDKIPGGRWYAMPGEAGLVMCTWPKGGAERAVGKGNDAWAAGYFNECMSGFEHQVAAHMLWEGLVEEGLAVERAIHDRYHPSKRNPWNEVECGDHYARAMASHGVFLAISGFEVHGPQGHLGFAPRVHPEDFRAAFVAPEGWGSYAQEREGHGQRHRIELKHGRLRLRSLRLPLIGGAHTAKLRAGERELTAHLAKDAPAAGAELHARQSEDGRSVLLTLAPELVLAAGEALEVELRDW
jgi:uncharacterized protein (DUF608 family)